MKKAARRAQFRKTQPVLVALILLWAVVPRIQASQEAFVPLDTLHLVSRGTSDSGPVTIDAVQDARGMREFTAHANGRLYKLTNAQLRQLGGGLFNSITLSLDHAMAAGSSAIFVKLGTASTGGAVQSRFVVISNSGAAVVKDSLAVPAGRASQEELGIARDIAEQLVRDPAFRAGLVGVVDLVFLRTEEHGTQIRVVYQHRFADGQVVVPNKSILAVDRATGMVYWLALE
jgi:hypothetical protein